MPLFDLLNEVDTGNLASDARWNYVRAGIEIAVSAGMNMTETARELRAGGLAFSDAKYREIFREISGYRSRFDYPAQLSGDVTPNPDLMVRGKYAIEGEYGYVGQYTYFDEETGQLNTRTFRIDNDSLLSRNDAVSRLEDHIATNEKYPLGQIIGGVKYLGAFKNP